MSIQAQQRTCLPCIQGEHGCEIRPRMVKSGRDPVYCDCGPCSARRGQRAAAALPPWAAQHPAVRRLLELPTP